MTPDPGPWHARIAELEAENARLEKRLATSSVGRLHNLADGLSACDDCGEPASVEDGQHDEGPHVLCHACAVMHKALRQQLEESDNGLAACQSESAGKIASLEAEVARLREEALDKGHRIPVILAQRDQAEAALAVSKSAHDATAQHYNAAMDRLMADRDRLSAALAAARSEAVALLSRCASFLESCTDNDELLGDVQAFLVPRQRKGHGE